MVQPSWLAGSLAALMMAVAVFSGVRLVASYARYVSVARDVELAHVAMALSMAGMLERNLTLIPGSAWIVIFIGSAVWFAGRSLGVLAGPGAVGGLRRGAPLVLSSGTMVYMLWAMPMWSGLVSLICGAHMVGMTSSGMTPAKLPALGLVLVALLFGEAVLLAQRLFTGGLPPAHATGLLLDGAASSDTPQDGGLVRPAGVSLAVLDLVVAERRAAGPVLTSPRLAMGSRVAMSLIMGYMILGMIHLA